MKQFTLCPSCSEYIFKLKLTKKEKEFALVCAKLMGVGIDEEFLRDINQEQEGISFTNEGDVEPYNQIKTIILAKREGISKDKLKKLAVKLK